MAIEHRNVGVEERIVEKKSDSSKVGTAIIKYATYLIIFFGVLYFLIQYILPKF
ncbi:hypothetical protein [Cohnella thailandensis]|jgi:hypothetical protein|uniref:Uncharacterized protein n=1 Tax=Cohnella thailandensis TaxID=557557 RepID=A0A841SSF1_9BACL|nr:hypothetical protein [Cohnella thailandensis]MBB6634864.1 hypothetical protein [Cohnella thailandensis]MBP1975914.1 hypothetical protein [Cohnella thailandensis]